MSEPSGMAVQGSGGVAGQPGAVGQAGIGGKTLPGTGEKASIEEQTEAEKVHEERVKQAESLFDNVGKFFKDAGKKMGFDFGD